MHAILNLWVLFSRHRRNPRTFIATLEIYPLYGICINDNTTISYITSYNNKLSILGRLLLDFTFVVIHVIQCVLSSVYTARSGSTTVNPSSALVAMALLCAVMVKLVM